jgi:hypothetical protein
LNVINWKYLMKLTAEPGWDPNERHCEAIPEKRWWSVMGFLLRTHAHVDVNCWKHPYVSPGSDGTICLSWYQGRERLSVEVKDHVYDISMKDRAGFWDTRTVTEAAASEVIQDFLQPAFLRYWKRYRVAAYVVGVILLTWMSEP